MKLSQLGIPIANFDLIQLFGSFVWIEADETDLVWLTGDRK